MSNLSTDSPTIQADQHATEVLRLFRAKYDAFYKNGAESAARQLASQTDMAHFSQTAVEFLATLISMPESIKFNVREGLVRWMSDIVEGRRKSTTVVPFLEILVGGIKSRNKGVDSFDIWNAVNRHFGNSNTKLIFPFLGLPYELRLIIYDNYFELETASSSKKLIDHIVPRSENRLSLIATNQQIYTEARKVLYTNFAFGLKSVPHLRQFFNNLRGYSYQIIRKLQIEDVSTEHVNVLAQILSGHGLLGVRSLKLVATPHYMGPASLRAQVGRTRKLPTYPVFKKKLRTAVDKLFYRSGFSIPKPPTLILIYFRKVQPGISHSLNFGQSLLLGRNSLALE
ncbi:hypothetical protein ABOM_002444 [Aspergillus bombycis]|uniref:Uncharacterized protein n=1 Tax=Aspergillus bombycis TaxID=109264 RepID=A0A1F8A9U7_9EURO|nr:hypothetical protein ABOM_002444 [Aspergillus bombycis]OGM48504.1 hypothetical protein ABOM_002444 [Aspergillus bombycis]